MARGKQIGPAAGSAPVATALFPLWSCDTLECAGLTSGSFVETHFLVLAFRTGT